MDNTFYKQAKLFDDCKFEHNPSSDQWRLVLSLILEKYFRDIFYWSRKSKLDLPSTYFQFLPMNHAGSPSG